MDSKEIIKLLQSNGFKKVRVTGSHWHFVKTGHNSIVTVPHPKKDIPKGTLNSIMKQAGLKQK